MSNHYENSLPGPSNRKRYFNGFRKALAGSSRCAFSEWAQQTVPMALAAANLQVPNFPYYIIYQVPDATQSHVNSQKKHDERFQTLTSQSWDRNLNW